ncbi:MAG TPA: UDP-N-acetylmuramoyl-L-alanine--D-glutamate ligase [Gaiellaceae bacterium]|nr:UDP-N-acetylmuramoyl-L-alanine--D-glutamate ligase [Gaiellaceae bacterium]
MGDLPGRALVLGLAVTGEAAALALAARGVEVIVSDRSPDAGPGRLAGTGVELRLGTEDAAVLEGVEVVVKSPGVPAESPVVGAARERGIPVWSEIELGWRLLPGNPVLGVTGTKGKTTTVRLLGAMFAAAGIDAVLAGNEHVPLSEVALTVEKGTWIVCELSSFQLEDVETFACDIALLLNIEPDHLDRHRSFEAYRAAKLRIFERAKTTIGPDDFSAGDPLPAEPRMPGEHNRANAAAATVAARAAGLPDDAIAEALRTFAGVPHRLELVRELRGVRYVNDSKATNTAAARRAVASYDAPLHLILGGYIKGEDFGPFAAELPANVRSIHLIGAATDLLADALDAAGRSYARDGDLAHAIAHATADARPGDVVLLSPATSSFDQFRNFEDRGDTFRRLVEELA